MQAGIPQEPADIVLSARLSLGESQRKFAQRLKTRQSLICKYETRQVSPPADLVIHCLNLLDAPPGGISTDDLIALVRQRLDGEGMQQARSAVAQVIQCLRRSL